MFIKEKPTPKREFVILRAFPENNTIEFEATEDVSQEIINSDLGQVKQTTYYSCLFVSRLLDFEEVLNYLQSFKSR